MILNPMECLVFWGHHLRGEGFMYGEALTLSNVYHWETTTWIGCRVKMHCVMRTLHDARGDLRMVRDQERNKTLECIQQQYQESEKNGQLAPNWGRGYIHRADHYFAQRLLKKQPEWRPGGCLADARDHRSQSREKGHDGWHAQPGRDRPQGLYAHNEAPERAPHGHPLGGGHPERVPQEFHDAFHSVREDQSDIALDSESETEVEEWDDIVAYDTETSRYTTVADQECRIVCNHHRTNKRRLRERHWDTARPNNWVSRYSEILSQITQSPMTIGEVMLTTTSGKAIPPSSSEILSCVHCRGVPTTLPRWWWVMGMVLYVALWRS